MIHFILGGAKSGKSQYAETRLMMQNSPWYYVATGQAWDDEMRHKIMVHQQRRGEGWKTVEAPLDLVSVLKELHGGSSVLIDCLTLWLTNLMMAKKDIEYETDCLISVLKNYIGRIFIVSNEVGQGIVPDNMMARRFVNEAGMLHQKIAMIADNFTVMQAGYPVVIKSEKG